MSSTAISATPEVISVYELLQDSQLFIPLYQRPYKWTEKNVRSLIDDVIRFKDKSAYRLGAIVIHREKDKHNIVDGQQRTVSLILLAQALFSISDDERFKDPKIKRQLQSLKEHIFLPSFSSCLLYTSPSPRDS